MAPWAVDVDRVAPWHRPAQPVKIKAGLTKRRQAGRLVDRIQTHQNAAMLIGRTRALLPVSNSSLKLRCQKLSITRSGCKAKPYGC